ncbi:hypothetical protein ACQR1I_20730 [Bradyrhizobium sp. HKCCYLS2038]|uniref:hypothetical protein n=1 Tax=unclassified Bradyrhizobium TaxID=2631580 RepID=UPI003EC09C79
MSQSVDAEVKKLAEQYRKAQKAGDRSLADLTKEAAHVLARKSAATEELRVIMSFANDA